MTGVITADPQKLWQVWRPAYPIRPREEESRNHDLYRLAFGLKVPVTLVDVAEMRSWTVEHSLPAGRLVIEHRMTPQDKDRIELGKTIQATGPMALLYRLVLVPRMRRDWRQELATLERRAAQTRPQSA